MAHAMDTLKRTLIYEAEAPPEEIMDHMAQLRDVDKDAEGRQRIGTVLTVVGVLLAIFGVVLSFNVERSSLPGFSAVGIGVLLGVAGGIYRAVAGKHNISDRRYELVAKTIDALRRDMPAEGQVFAQVDFRSPTHKTKFQNKGKVGVWNVTFYQDPWLTLRGRFLDGTSFLLQIADATQKRGRWKRSRSGKSKYKSKTKTATIATLRLKAKPQKYPQLEQFAANIATAAVLPDWCELKNTAGTSDSLSMKVGTKVEWAVQDPGDMTTLYNGGHMINMMFLSLYRVLNLCKGQGATP